MSISGVTKSGPLAGKISHSTIPFLTPAVILVIGTVVLVILFWATASGAVRLWGASSTYTYAYLIAPLSAYLIWDERKKLIGLEPRSTFCGVALVGVFSFVWLFADLMGINVGRHVALMGMFQGLCLGVLGFALYKKLVFPLNYLWLMVPTGEFLIAPLQAFAHSGAVVMLQVSGIPVYAEGLLIQVPQGNFLVEPSCAGLNFLLSALALSLIYGRVMYQNLRTRILCVVIAVATAILSNVVRIYLIIALTEWTDQKIGIADDHLFFGWGFFSIIMLILIWLGLKVAEAPVAEKALVKPHAPPFQRAHFSRTVGVFLSLLFGMAVGPAFAQLAARNHIASMSAFVLPAQLGPWQEDNLAPTNWAPSVTPGDASLVTSYVHQSGQQVNVSITVYDPQREGHEAADAGNQPADGKIWNVIGSQSQSAIISNSSVSISSATLSSGAALRQALYWYEVGSCVTSSRLLAKLCKVRQQALGQSSAGAFIVLSASSFEDGALAKNALLDVGKRLPAVGSNASNLARVNEE